MNKDEEVKRVPTPETHYPHQAGIPSKQTETAAEPKKAAKQDVNERATAQPLDPMDNSNNDPRVQEIRRQQEAEMKEYQKNYKKNVAKKSDDA